MKKIIHFFRYQFFSLRYKYAVLMADRAHKNSPLHDRYFVMPDERDRLIVINRKSFRKFKLYGKIVQKAMVGDMIKECFYMTPDRGENNKLPARIVEGKRKMYLRYAGVLPALKKD